MKTPILLSILFCFFLQSCCNQTKLANFQKDYFDVKKFYKNNLHGGYKVDTLKNGDIVEWNQSTEFYQKSIKARDSPYILYKKYNKKNYFYSGGGMAFHLFSIGKWSSYDENGNLIKEEDKDKDFIFSIYNLQKKMKMKYGVDLSNEKNFRNVRRSYMKELDRSFYIVFLQGNPLYIIERILIDGNTGEILYQDYYKEDHGEILEHIEDIYLKKLQKEKAKE